MSIDPIDCNCFRRGLTLDPFESDKHKSLIYSVANTEMLLAHVKSVFSSLFSAGASSNPFLVDSLRLPEILEKRSSLLHHFELFLKVKHCCCYMYSTLHV